MELSTKVNFVANWRVSTTTQEGVFILPKVIKKHEDKRSGGRTELTKLKTIFLVKKYLNEHIIYYNFSFLIEKSIWNLLSKHFNVGSTLFLGWYDVATSHNVKSTLKQRCVRQRWNLQHWTTVKQRCISQRWIEQR